MLLKKLFLPLLLVFSLCCCVACTSAKPDPAPDHIIATPDDNYYTAIVVNGVLYDGMAYGGNLPDDAVFVGQIKKITDEPKEDLECNYGEVGRNVYTFEFEGDTFVGIESLLKNDDGSTGIVIVGMSSSQFGRWAESIRS